MNTFVVLLLDKISHEKLLEFWCISGHFLCASHLAGPDPGDQIPVILQDVEYFQDSSGVTKHGDAGVGDGEVQGEEVGWLKGSPLLAEDEDDQTVSEPGQPPCGSTDAAGWSFSATNTDAPIQLCIEMYGLMCCREDGVKESQFLRLSKTVI